MVLEGSVTLAVAEFAADREVADDIDFSGLELRQLILVKGSSAIPARPPATSRIPFFADVLAFDSSGFDGDGGSSRLRGPFHDCVVGRFRFAMAGDTDAASRRGGVKLSSVTATAGLPVGRGGTNFMAG